MSGPEQATLPGVRSARGDRWGWAVLASVSLAVLALAHQLEPAPGGLGTHTQLGLPPCAFHQLMGHPCPACGLTTSFAHFGHFSWRAALIAHPLGPPLCLLLLGLCVRAWVGLVRGDSVSAFAFSPYISRAALLITLSLFAVWCVRFFA